MFSGVGDIDGFRHDDLDVSPAKGTFTGPRFGNTEDLAFAGKNPLVIVRIGTAENQECARRVFRDGGETWQELANEPPTGYGAGAIAISADAQKRRVDSAPGEPYLQKLGRDWTAVRDRHQELRVVADIVNRTGFYAFDSRSEHFITAPTARSVSRPWQRDLPAQDG